jgi:hypothetical protein
MCCQAFKALKPGGRLVFSTCTINPDENERNTAWAQRELGLKVVDASHVLREQMSGASSSSVQHPQVQHASHSVQHRRAWCDGRGGAGGGSCGFRGLQGAAFQSWSALSGADRAQVKRGRRGCWRAGDGAGSRRLGVGFVPWLLYCVF